MAALHQDRALNTPNLVTVIAHPKARQARVVPTLDGVFHVYVSEAAEQGKANRAIRRLLAAYLDLPPSHLELRQGQTSKIKTFSITP